MSGGTVICATCLRCGHRGAISAETLQRYGHGPNVTLAFLSRFAICEECGSKAVKLERLEDPKRGGSLRADPCKTVCSRAGPGWPDVPMGSCVLVPF